MLPIHVSQPFISYQPSTVIHFILFIHCNFSIHVSQPFISYQPSTEIHFITYTHNFSIHVSQPFISYQPSAVIHFKLFIHEKTFQSLSYNHSFHISHPLSSTVYFLIILNFQPFILYQPASHLITYTQE